MRIFKAITITVVQHQHAHTYNDTHKFTQEYLIESILASVPISSTSACTRSESLSYRDRAAVNAVMFSLPASVLGWFKK